jgi:hypothetical protein
VECETCRRLVGVGQFPFCPHEAVGAGFGDGFEPFFDVGLGTYVSGWGDIRQSMREQKLDFRDHPSAEKREYREHRIHGGRGR